jgi:16S rRNA (guanine1207-N2)-methyltransferase
MNPALETLLLALRGESAPGIPPRALFLRAEPHPDLAAHPALVGWQPLKPLAARWENAGFQRLDQPAGTWPLVMLLPGKSRDETLALFATAHDLLEPGGRLAAAMPNTAGAGRYEKELARASRTVSSLQKHKCRAFQATLDAPWDEALLADWRALGSPRRLPDTGFTTTAGIFSADGIDPGSAFLAAHLPAHLRGRVADLGAGWGYLSHEILHRCPGVERIDLYEADARALACARGNVRPTGHTAAGFKWHDVTAGVPDGYDAVVMNPPFHTGRATDVDLGRAFIRSAVAALKRGGKLLLVANRQLPYEAVLTDAGMAWRNAGENPTYKLLVAEKRR